MYRTFLFTLICGGVLLPLCRLPADRLARAQETAKVAPAANDAEIDEIHIVRLFALGAAKEADLTNMRLGLWFPADWKTKERRSPPLIHIQELSGIEDDTGRVLSTPGRLSQIECLRGEVRGSTWRGLGGREGPTVSLLLDAPARGAGKLKAVKGRAQVTLTKPVSVTFKDLAALNGKTLEHPDAKSLAPMKVRFSIEHKDGAVSVSLSAPVKYASPWNRGRLDGWEVLDAGKALALFSESESGEDEGVTVERTYRLRNVKDLSLRLVVLEEVESRAFDFDFQNVALP